MESTSASRVAFIGAGYMATELPDNCTAGGMLHNDPVSIPSTQECRHKFVLKREK